MELLTVENLVALATLATLEIVLGIDNLVVIAILTDELPAEQRTRARRVGLVAAGLMRIALLLALTWFLGLTGTLFEVAGVEVTGRALILFVGGMLLIAKATHEIHTKLERPDEHPQARRRKAATFTTVIAQIMLFDMVFSVDSVITAIGVAREVWVMVTAILLAVAVMIIFANPVSGFVERHPSVKMLALSFLLLIGVMLVAEAFGQHIERGYIYFAMGFSLLVEMLNLRARRVEQRSAA